VSLTSDWGELRHSRTVRSSEVSEPMKVGRRVPITVSRTVRVDSIVDSADPYPFLDEFGHNILGAMHPYIRNTK
jgi:hypothetical protein